MTIEEKLRLTIYEAEDAGIITESDKVEMISFIEEKRPLDPFEKYDRSIDRLTKSNNKKCETHDAKYNSLSNKYDELREKERKLIDQMYDSDSDDTYEKLRQQRAAIRQQLNKLRSEMDKLTPGNFHMDNFFKNQTHIKRTHDKLKKNLKDQETAALSDIQYDHLRSNMMKTRSQGALGKKIKTGKN